MKKLIAVIAVLLVVGMVGLPLAIVANDDFVISENDLSDDVSGEPENSDSEEGVAVDVPTDTEIEKNKNSELDKTIVENQPEKKDVSLVPLDAVSDAASLASSINSGPVGSIVSAAASGSTVTVTTKSKSTSAPRLSLDIPTGVTVVWKAEYINMNFGDSGGTDATDVTLLTLSGTGKFKIEDGASIQISESSTNSAGFLNAIHSNEPTIEMTGGDINVQILHDKIGGYAILLGDLSSNPTPPSLYISGGDVSLNNSATDTGPYGIDVGLAAIRVASSTNASEINISGGNITTTISGNTDPDYYTGYIMNDDSDQLTINISGGTLITDIGSGTSMAIGIMTLGNLNLTGGRLYARGDGFTYAIQSFGKTIVGENAGIFVEGKNAELYNDKKGPPDITINPNAATVQLTNVVGYAEAFKAGSSILLTPIRTPVDKTFRYFDWKSSDESIASVDGNGNVTGHYNGTVTITATARDFTGLQCTFQITVTDGSVLPDNPDSAIYPVMVHFGEYRGTGTTSAKVNADDRKFVRLISSEADAVVDSSNYVISQGSTIITLTEAYAQTYKAGNYYFIAEYSDGVSDPIKFSVISNNNSGGHVVNTGDESNPLVIFIIGITSLAMLIALIVFKRKSKTPEAK